MISDVRQVEMHTAEPLVPDPNSFEVEIAIAKLKRYKSSGSVQILAELIQAGCEMLHSKIHKPVNSIGNQEDLAISGKSLLFYQFTSRVIKLY
jgi:hypothetical protein